MRRAIVLFAVVGLMVVPGCGGGNEGAPETNSQAPAAMPTEQVSTSTPTEQASTSPEEETSAPDGVVGTFSGYGFKMINAFQTARRASFILVVLEDGTEVRVPCAGETIKSVKGKSFFIVEPAEEQTVELEAGPNGFWILAEGSSFPAACP